MPRQEKAGDDAAVGGNQERVNLQATPDFRAIDAARTLAYDAARRSFVFCDSLRGSSDAYEVCNSLLECRYAISFRDEFVLRPAAGAPA